MEGRADLDGSESMGEASEWEARYWSPEAGYVWLEMEDRAVRNATAAPPDNCGEVDSVPPNSTASIPTPRS
jgi:hypothetical protein